MDIKVPEVVDIEPEKSVLTEYTEDTEIINPFQTVPSNPITNTNVINENVQSTVTPFSETIPSVTSVKDNTNMNTETINNVVSQPSEQYFNPYKLSEETVAEVKEEKPSEDSLLNEFGEVNLPKVINKVRDFVNSLSEVSSLIETSEVDLTDKYQIVIEIDKNTPM